MSYRDSETPDHPWRIEPYLVLSELGEEVPLVRGPIRLTGSRDAVLHADVNFKWQPTQKIAFEGESDPPISEIGDSSLRIESEGENAIQVPVRLTGIERSDKGSQVRGVVTEPFSIGTGPFTRLTFSLANFPEYFGDPIKYQQDNASGIYSGRLTFHTEQGECRIDKIWESQTLAQRAHRESGYFISHVGQWIPTSGAISTDDVESLLRLLHFWFGFLRGAWAGPLFPRGLTDDVVVWQNFAAWKLGESCTVPTWLPSHSKCCLSTAFSGFVRKWADPSWNRPLFSAISWYVEANAYNVALETRIALAQIALELLAWVQIVETDKIRSRSDFSQLSAAGKIRTLLHHIGVPLHIPTHLHHLSVLQDNDAFDGPGVITKVRNALIHATERKREFIASLDGRTLSQCGDLSLEYIELVILAVCGYKGIYARRGWQGWKGDDEALVPWTNNGQQDASPNVISA